MLLLSEIKYVQPFLKKKEEKKKTVCPFSTFAGQQAMLSPKKVLNCSILVQQPRNSIAGFFNMQQNAIISPVTLFTSTSEISVSSFPALEMPDVLH